MERGSDEEASEEVDHALSDYDDTEETIFAKHMESMAYEQPGASRDHEARALEGLHSSS
jgi:hypothetical protein